jgi:limonene-1,2-epoxide hydrolase
MKDPKELVLEYHKAFHSRDKAAVRKMLADDGTFIGPLNTFKTADAFLEGAFVFMQLTHASRIKQVIAEGNDVCVFYDYITIVPTIPSIPIASWFKVEAGKITFFHTHFNPGPFLEAKENGDVDKALLQMQV